MAWDSTRVYVGTVGQSIFRSEDGGETFRRASVGLFPECDVRALLVDPRDPRTLYAGTNRGFYHSRDGAETWEHLESPLDHTQVWSLTQDPRDPDTLFAGVCPAALYRSRDRGETWQRLPAAMPDRIEGALLVPRVTCVVIDPEDTRRVYAGVEIGGVRRSLDGGESWETLTEGLSSQDIHGLAVSPRAPRTLLATTNNDVNRSLDDGATWEPLRVGETFPWPYCRAAAPAPDDPNLVYVGAGNGPPGSQGGLYRTADRGQSWERLPLPAAPNSTIWNFGFHRADPRRLYAASISGYLYRSFDAGASWEKLPHEFGEVRALAWAPTG
jgi:photosystem II stability/assembly factor-like uncharacterized protein